VTLARDNGLPAGSIVVGALPRWLMDEPGRAARALAEVAVRRALYPAHPLAFVEPQHPPEMAVPWSFIHAAAAVHAGEIALVLRRGGHGREASAMAARLGRSAAAVASDVAAATDPGSLTGTALEHARGMVHVATETLQRLADDGWRAVAGDDARELNGSRRIETVAERTDPFDPFDWEPERTA
jgi:hypothetical protein